MVCIFPGQAIASSGIRTKYTSITVLLLNIPRGLPFLKAIPGGKKRMDILETALLLTHNTSGNRAETDCTAKCHHHSICTCNTVPHTHGYAVLQLDRVPLSLHQKLKMICPYLYIQQGKPLAAHRGISTAKIDQNDEEQISLPTIDSRHINKEPCTSSPRERQGSLGLMHGTYSA